MRSFSGISMSAANSIQRYICGVVSSWHFVWGMGTLALEKRTTNAGKQLELNRPAFPVWPTFHFLQAGMVKLILEASDGYTDLLLAI